MKKFATAALALILVTGLFWMEKQSASINAVPKMALNKLTVYEAGGLKQLNERKRIDEAISSYLQNYLPKHDQSIMYKKNTSDKLFEAHELLGYEKKENKIYAYVWSGQEIFYYGDKKQGDGGGFNPMAFTLNKDSKGKYYVVECGLPDRGDGYFQSVKRLFPAKYQDEILSGSYHWGIADLINQKVRVYFKVSGTPYTSITPASTALAVKAETPVYSVSIPKGWSIEKSENNCIIFKSGNEVIGGVDSIKNYNSDFSDWFYGSFKGNEVQNIIAYTPKGVSYRVQVYEINNSIRHCFFYFNNYSYDLYFDFNKVDRSLMLSIAKSFVSNTPLNNAVIKDGTLITATGVFYNEMYNDIKIKIKQTDRITSDLIIRRTPEVSGSIDKQKIKNGDRVLITYVKNGYNQFILKKIVKESENKTN